MPTRTKIKIDDVSDLRQRLDKIYDTSPKNKKLAKWSILLAKHIMTISGFDDVENEIILNGFRINEDWQRV